MINPRYIGDERMEKVANTNRTNQEMRQGIVGERQHQCEQAFGRRSGILTDDSEMGQAVYSKE